MPGRRPRTKEKNGYTALQLGSAGKVKNVTQGRARPVRRRQGRAEAQGRRNSACARTRSSRSAPRSRPTTSSRASWSMSRGTSIGKGFAGGMKRWNFGGLRATHGVSISHRSIGSTGGRQDPGKTFKNKKMPGHMGVDRVTTQNLGRCRLDVERGLIMVEGRGAGRQGRLDHGARRGQEAAAEGRAEAGQVPRRERRGAGGTRHARRRRARDMDRSHHPRRRGGRLDRCRTRFSASSRAPTSCSAACAGSSPSASAARIRPRVAARFGAPKKIYKQKGTGGARHGAARVPQFRGGGRAFGPSCAAMRMTCRRRCGRSLSGMPCRRRRRTGTSSCSNKAHRSTEAKYQGA